MVLDSNVNLSYCPLSTLPVLQRKNFQQISIQIFKRFLLFCFSITSQNLRFFFLITCQNTFSEAAQQLVSGKLDSYVPTMIWSFSMKHPWQKNTCICANTLFIGTNDWFFSRSWDYYIGMVAASHEITSEFWVVIKWWNVYFIGILIGDIYLLFTPYGRSNVWITYNYIFLCLD